MFSVFCRSIRVCQTGIHQTAFQTCRQVRCLCAALYLRHLPDTYVFIRAGCRFAASAAYRRKLYSVSSDSENAHHHSLVYCHHISATKNSFHQKNCSVTDFLMKGGWMPALRYISIRLSRLCFLFVPHLLIQFSQAAEYFSPPLPCQSDAFRELQPVSKERPAFDFTHVQDVLSVLKRPYFQISSSFPCDSVL